jgi:hypothetical protein
MQADSPRPIRQQYEDLLRHAFTQGVVKSDLALYAGGVTWVDEEYDERLGAALRPLEQDFRGFNYGLQMNADTRAALHKAFFLDALTMPERAPEMTAYEVGQRVQLELQRYEQRLHAEVGYFRRQLAHACRGAE